MINKITNYISLQLKKMQLNINNRNIKTKTIFVYVICVLFPVLVTNVVIIGSTLKASLDEEKENFNNIAESVGHDISTTLESAVYVTVDLYASNSINNFLDTWYDNQAEYFKMYNRVFENYVFYASSKHLVSSITFYSDNGSMINGGRYYRIDSIQNEIWYQEFLKANKDLLIYPYYNNSKYISYKKRMVSVIRKLNFIGLNNVEKFVKLDLNFNKINENVISSAFNTKVYICHGDKIIFSNDESDKNLKKEFKDASSIPMNEVQIKKSMTAFGFDFDIYLIGYKSSYAAMLKDKLWLIGILFLADALIPAVMLTLFSNSITKRILLLGSLLKKVKREEFELIPEIEGKDEIGELLYNYNLMAARMKNLIEYEYKSKLKQQELHLARQQAELLALHSQINPHFLFNVLESIRMRSVIKGENETSKLIESLARLMRKSAEWGEDLITIEQEIEFTSDYLNLQKYRFGDDFHYKIRVSKDCNSYLIPSLVLVSFAENSCVHGLNRIGHAGSIFISIYEENTFLYIEIEDTGIGMELEQVQKLEKLLNEADIGELQKASSLGMLNACIRLKKYLGEQTQIIIESEKQIGTCIIIKIPIKNVQAIANVIREESI